MTRRGRKRRLVLEDEYWKLILDGMPTVEACRQIGIGRNGRTTVNPAKTWPSVSDIRGDYPAAVTRTLSQA
ncbi:MAG: putative transposase, partial [Mycobacterium sp.]|nr:putative transposase [Mycobacterium sp.]